MLEENPEMQQDNAREEEAVGMSASRLAKGKRPAIEEETVRAEAAMGEQAEEEPRDWLQTLPPWMPQFGTKMAKLIVLLRELEAQGPLRVAVYCPYSLGAPIFFAKAEFNAKYFSVELSRSWSDWCHFGKRNVWTRVLGCRSDRSGVNGTIPGRNGEPHQALNTFYQLGSGGPNNNIRVW
jgi:hypothetical protein